MGGGQQAFFWGRTQDLFWCNFWLGKVTFRHLLTSQRLKNFPRRFCYCRKFGIKFLGNFPEFVFSDETFEFFKRDFANWAWLTLSKTKFKKNDDIKLSSAYICSLIYSE